MRWIHCYFNPILQPFSNDVQYCSDLLRIAVFEHFSVTSISAVLNLITTRCIVTSFCILLTGYLLHEQQQVISIWSYVREWTHVLLVNTPCAHLHSFCAYFVSNGLAPRVTLIRVSRVWLRESVTRGLTCNVPQYVIFVALLFKCYTLYFHRNVEICF
jgi:hypothetical protein